MKGRERPRAEPPRGLEDAHDPYLLLFERISSQLVRIARRYGFTRIETPAVERLNVFSLTAPVNPDTCYIFHDKAGRELVLRPDINAPISRAVVKELTHTPLPLKLFTMGKVYRYRHSARREFHMFGLETFGVADVSADAEIVRIVADIVEEMGFRSCELEYSNPAIFLDFIKEIAQGAAERIDASKLLYQLRNSLSGEQREKALSGYSFPKGAAHMLNEMLDCPGEDAAGYAALQSVVNKVPSLEGHLNHLRAFQAGLAAQGIASTRFHLGNLHGSGFYSGLTYRLTPSGSSRELADGGRYDHFTQALGGRHLPATGMGLGVERLLDLAQEQGLIRVTANRVSGCLVVFYDNETAGALRPFLRRARSSGTIIEERLGNNKRETVIKYARSKAYPKILLVKKQPASHRYELEIVRLGDKISSESMPLEKLEDFSRVLSDL